MPFFKIVLQMRPMNGRIFVFCAVFGTWGYDTIKKQKANGRVAMLKLIVGVVGSGKTSRVFDAIAKRAKAQKTSILLVPEQFSSTAERMVYRRFGNEGIAQVQVLSFRTLAERILKASGDTQLAVVDDAARAVFVRRALDAVGQKLVAFSRQRRSTTFCNLCAQTLAELKTAGVTPALLLQIAQSSEDSKLEELALIYEAYEAVLQNTAMDPEDRLAIAAERAGCGILDGVACFVDGFDGFTAPEYVMLRQLLCLCDDVTVALCCDGLGAPQEELSLFTPVRKAAARLIGLAEGCGVAVDEPLVLGGAQHMQAEGLCAVAQVLQSGQAEKAEHAGVWLTQPADEWEEVRLAAAEMRRLALSGVPYSSMALVCRDIAAYESVVRRQFGLYGIPFFVDAPTTIEYSAPIVFMRAALSVLRGGLSSQAVLSMLKSGLCGYTESEIYELENYVYTWAPKAEQWRNPFSGNPDGYLTEMSRQAQNSLEVAERLRSEIVPKVDGFMRKARSKNAASISQSLYELMEEFSAEQHADQAAQCLQGQGDELLAAQSGRAWDMAMQMLDQMADILGEDEVEPEMYDELLLILVRSTDFGQPPQTLECALFSSADRMRLAAPQYCFVVGICEGEFPMEVGYSGLLTHRDRDAIIAGGVQMQGSFENRVLLEEMFFYRALCAPSRGLYLSWPQRRAGEAKSPSGLLVQLQRELQPPPLELSEQQLAATPAAAYEMLGGVWRSNSVLAATLHAALEGLQSPQWNRALELLSEVENTASFKVHSRDAIAKLVGGGEMQLSATMAEKYYSCHFAYYMERLLRVRQRRKAEISPMESGTFVHYVLEKVMQECADGFAQSSDQVLQEIAQRVSGEFIEQFLPDDTRRSAWKLEQIMKATVQLLYYMRDAAAQSGFVTDALEVNIGEGEGAVAPLCMQSEGGVQIRLRGKVDRVDVLQDGGQTYLSVVDYKTGDKELSLDELYCGLNMQMVLYLDALCEGAKDRYKNPTPAAVLYIGADPAPSSAGKKEENKPPFKVNGLLLNNEQVLRALDATGSGVYAPFGYKNDGTPKKTKSLVSEQQFDEIRSHARHKLCQMADGVYDGNFDAIPLVKSDKRPCQYCPYRAACRHEDGQNEQQVQRPADVFTEDDRQKGGENNG